MKPFSRIQRLLLLFLLLGTVQVQAQQSGPSKDLTKACDALARTLAMNISLNSTVALRRFSSSGGIPTLLGTRIQDLLTNTMTAASNRKFHVVERLETPWPMHLKPLLRLRPKKKTEAVFCACSGLRMESPSLLPRKVPQHTG